MTVYCDGNVVVTAPVGLSLTVIEKFIADKKQWIIDKVNFFKSTVNKSVPASSKKDYLKYKNEALVLVSERLKFFNEEYNFPFNKICIKNQKTRWGSCSKKRNINFNYKLVFLPERQRDYIIVHEICHLKEFNHSPKFWSLVGKILPDYLEIKHSLRKR